MTLSHTEITAAVNALERGQRYRVDTIKGLLADSLAREGQAGGYAAYDDERFPTPYLRLTQHLSELPQFTPTIMDDILSGASTTDYTTQFLAAMADPEAKASLVLPYGASMLISSWAMQPSWVQREIVGYGFTFKQSQDLITGNINLVKRSFSGAASYGQFAALRLEGATFDQNGKFTKGQIFRQLYCEGSRFINLTVRHRDAANVDVTVDPSTDVFTAVAHPFANGDVINVHTKGNTRPAPLGNAVPYWVISRTADTFKISAAAGSSTPVDITDIGDGAVFVSLAPNWAFCLGGRDFVARGCKVLNGKAIFADGFHVYHGSDWGIENCYAESGDDAFVAGFEAGDAGIAEHLIRNGTFSSCRGKSQMGCFAKVYTNGANCPVTGVEFNGLVGRGGIERNGGVAVADETGLDATAVAAQVNDISFDDVNIDVGDAARTQTGNPYAILVQGASGVRFRGQIRMLGPAGLQERRCTLSDNVYLDYSVKNDFPINEGTVADGHRLAVRRRSRNNLLPNATGTGSVAGLPGHGPNSWNLANAVSNGISRSIVALGQTAEGKIIPGFRFFGTATADDTHSMQFSSLTALPAVAGQTYRLRAQLARVDGTLAGITTARLYVRGRHNGTLQEGSGGITVPLSPVLATWEISYSLVDPLTNSVTGDFEVVVLNGETVDITVAIIPETLERIAA